MHMASSFGPMQGHVLFAVVGAKLPAAPDIATGGLLIQSLSCLC